MSTDDGGMAAPSSGGIVKIGKGEELRHVERDVIIPKIMKEHAMKLCSEYVKGLSPYQCFIVQGKTDACGC